MIRLLMGITLSESGGSQRVVYEIIANLPEDRYDITLMTSPGGELLDWISDLNLDRRFKIRILTSGCLAREISLARDFAALRWMLSEMRQNRYDIAHFHNSKMGILGRIAARIAGIPKIIYTVHGWGLNRKTTGRMYGVLSLMERAVARFSTKIVFVSGHDLDIGIRNHWADPARCSVVFNGISDQQDSPFRLPVSPPVIVFVARLTQPKNPQMAIKVSCRLAARGIAHTFMIVGDGPLRDGCRILLEELPCRDQVIFTGQRHDVRELIRKADIFCLFSAWEGLPISIIEAMLAGLPVVASRVGGIPEMVVHGKTGYLIDHDNETMAVERLAELLQDQELRQAYGHAGRDLALEKFTSRRMVAGYREIYEN